MENCFKAISLIINQYRVPISLPRALSMSDRSKTLQHRETVGSKTKQIITCIVVVGLKISLMGKVSRYTAKNNHTMVSLCMDRNSVRVCITSLMVRYTREVFILTNLMVLVR
jgi:hypothetical protein